ncbi:MAG: helix-turn-helix transcriptional regulator [Bacteroidales bacterium]|nr:helix-turn-helix transcriptional regulator [Bacteroidales bacterium]
MSTSKGSLFEPVFRQRADIFKVLGHPARLAILNFLIKTNSCFTGDISRELPLARTTVNQHLAGLKNSGLIRGHISGSKTNYCINPTKITELKAMLKEFESELMTNSDFNCE